MEYKGFLIVMIGSIFNFDLNEHAAPLDATIEHAGKNRVFITHNGAILALMAAKEGDNKMLAIIDCDYLPQDDSPLAVETRKEAELFREMVESGNYDNREPGQQMYLN